MQPGADDEGRHWPISEHADWEESWDLSFYTGDGGLGGYVCLGLWPHQGRAWFWAALVGEGRPLVTVVDHELLLPRPPALDLRAEGLWTSFTCETALEHWSVGLEAFGVALDDPTEAYRSGRGDRTALGLDLEWETAGPVADHPQADGYHLPCVVHGEVLVGPEVLAFDGWGGRTHTWGDGGWWATRWCMSSGRLDDGTIWYGSVADQGLGDDAVPRPGRLSVREGPDDVAVEPRHPAPVLVARPGGGTSRLARSLCRYVTPDGRRGAGWTEWNEPGACPSS